jgi:alginate O-acetyltransferase complex protein AlgI
MLFNSFEYLAFFFVVMLGAQLLTRRAWQHSFLLVASICFYASWNAYLVILILASAVLDFFLAQWMGIAKSPGRRRLLLICSLSGNLGLLAFFKYTNFLLETAYFFQQWTGLHWMEKPPHLNIILPVGISFYTFQSLSYTVDVYRGKLAAIRDFRSFLLFISFFPQLVAGPIVRAVDFLPQLEKRAEVLPQNLKIGFSLFLVGLVKKVVFADTLGLFVEKIYGQPTAFASLPIILATMAYAVQIYCDFSGYTDMAIGSAVALGFWLPKNFSYPYFAASLTEFWQRWHISLSTWLRDYLYIPLGGNRRGAGRTYVNLLATMLLGGLWHGAKWTFVLWGAYQGVLLAVHRFYSGKVENGERWRWFNRLRQTGWFRMASVAGTMYLVLIGWIFFRAERFGDLGHLLQKFVFIDGFHRYGGVRLREALTVVLLIAVFGTMHLISCRTGGLAKRLAVADNRAWCACVSGGILLLMLLAPSRSPEFIYFQF